MREDQDEARGSLQAQREERPLRVGGRDEDEPAEEGREDVVSVPRAVGHVLAEESGTEEESAVLHPEKEARGEGAGGRRRRGRAHAARERQALLERQVDPAAPLPRRLQHGGRGDGGRVAARRKREATAVSPDLEEPYPRPVRETRAHDVARAVERGAENVVADAEVRDGGRGEDGDEAHTTTR
jgi:hypothetical protein